MTTLPVPPIALSDYPFGLWVRTRRKALGLTQKELSQRSEVPQSHISAIENNRRSPSRAETEALHQSLAAEPLQIVENHRDRIREVFSTYGLSDVAVFGSTVKGTATTDSDIDFLATAEKPVGLLAVVRLERELEVLLSFPVDVVVHNLRLSDGSTSNPPDGFVPARKEALPL